MNVYRLNDVDWYMAETLEAAILACEADVGESREEIISEPYKLTDEELKTSEFNFEDGTKVSFKEYLEAFIERNDIEPQFFATTEF